MMELFQTNFDLNGVAAEPVPSVPSADPQLMTPLEVSDLLEAARAEAYERGLEAGRAEALTESATIASQNLASIATGIAASLGDMGAELAEHRAGTEQKVAELLTLIFEQVFPSFLSAHAGEIATANILRSMKFSQGSPTLSVSVSPDLHDAVGTLLASADPGESGLQVTVNKNERLQSGAFELEWQNGRVDYDLERACHEVLKALKAAATQDNEMQVRK